MVSINYSAREVCCKIVYYGPGLSGKTTNLQYIHTKVPQDTRGKLISLATEADRTLYFDFLPINIGTINDFQAKFQLYTVPGQVYYNATRKLVLRGVDGLVFVADSQADKMDENIESLANLIENLREYGYDPDSLPLVLQYNKRDLPGVLSVEEMNETLNTRNLPWFEASATQGNGVFDTLKLIIKLVLDRAKSTSASAITKTSPAPTAAPQPPTSPTADYPSGKRVAAESSDLSDQDEATESRPEPVGVGASRSDPTPSVDGGESRPAPSPSGIRPYPGSNTESSVDRKTKPTGFSRAGEELPAESLSKNMDIAANQAGKVIGGTDRPQMAPSLKRRNARKKRGFFKRLFGIK